MMLNIPNIFTAEETADVLRLLNEAGPSIWKDGASSAFGEAGKVKQNQQCDPQNPLVQNILDKARAALLKNSAFVAATQPESFSRMLINSYGPGMSYGNHLDASYIRDQRTDISITLFLTPPTAYNGGDLVLASHFCEMSVKGEQGGVFLYPSTSLHRVQEVTSGNRIAIVGWVKSRIKHPHQREILFDLEQSLSDLGDDNSQRETYMRLLGVKNRLLREWGD